MDDVETKMGPIMSISQFKVHLLPKDGTLQPKFVEIEAERSPKSRKCQHLGNQIITLGTERDLLHPPANCVAFPAPRKQGHHSSIHEAVQLVDPCSSILVKTIEPARLNLSLVTASFFPRERSGCLPPLDLLTPSSAQPSPHSSLPSPITSHTSPLSGNQEKSFSIPHARGRSGSLPPLLLEPLHGFKAPRSSGSPFTGHNREKCVPGQPGQMLQQSPARRTPKGSICIPFKPHGRMLTISLLTTWGDPHFVGLTGIEVFDDSCSCISDPQVNPAVLVHADPASINVLPEYHDDPRTVDKLLDGINHTCDDSHMWLAPFSEGRAHNVYIDFGRTVVLTMLRLWNYNKSRIHSFRGARLIEVMVDERLVFRGDIQKAPGHVDDSSGFSEHILFNNNKKQTGHPEQSSVGSNSLLFDFRPDWKSIVSSSRGLLDVQVSGEGLSSGKDFCPATATRLRSDPVDGHRPGTAVQGRSSEIPCPCMSDPELSPTSAEPELPKGRTITITILNTWGDLRFAGLTSLQVLNQFQQPYQVTPSMLFAFPKDITVLPEYESDDRVLANLVDGHNITTNPGCMWLVPLWVQGRPTVQVRFPKDVKIAGVRVWNYNSSPECSLSGVKQLHIAIDGHSVAPEAGFLLQKAPGHNGVDFGQSILFLKPPALQARDVI
eukprot:GGOE01021461.1.p1 GENE.GGOE01021461.1~~GGOE01021461.1.p1  ORF type:complete len:663 (+),score=48.98 GGOE01021461.1:102-2090(+)